MRPARSAHELTEVFCICGTTQTFAVQHGIVAQFVGKTTARVNVGEVQLAAGLEHAVDLVHHQFFERGQIHDAVRHDEVDRLVLDADCLKVFDVAKAEFDIRLLEAETLSLLLLVALGNFELFGRHVDANHVPRGTDELREHIDVAARTATQVEHRCPFERWRDGAATSVETCNDFVGDERHHVEHVFRRRHRFAMRRIGMQVI